MKKKILLFFIIFLVFPKNILASELILTAKETVINSGDIKYYNSHGKVIDLPISTYTITSGQSGNYNYANMACVSLNPGKKLDSSYYINLEFDSRKCSDESNSKDYRCMTSSIMVNVSDKYTRNLTTSLFLAQSGIDFGNDNYLVYKNTSDKMKDGDFTLINMTTKLNNNYMFYTTGESRTVLLNSNNELNNILKSGYTTNSYNFLHLKPIEDDGNKQELLCMSNYRTIVQDYHDENYTPIEEDESNAGNNERTDDLPYDCKISTEMKLMDKKMDVIINKKPLSTKDNYNEANRIGGAKYLVNNDYCQLYCRETIKYHFYDTVYAMAGQYFIYDISPTDTNVTAYFTGEKQCTTAVNYKEFKTDYLKKTKAVTDTFSEYVKWLKAVKIKAQVHDQDESCICDWKECSYGCIELGENRKGLFCKKWGNIEIGMINSEGPVTIWHRGWNGEDYQNFYYNGSANMIGGSVIQSFRDIVHLVGGKECKGERPSSGACNAQCTPGIPTNIFNSAKEADDQANSDAKSFLAAALEAYREALHAREQAIADIWECSLSDTSEFAGELKTTNGNISFQGASGYGVKGEISKNYNNGTDFGFFDDEADKNVITYGETGVTHDKEYGETPVLEGFLVPEDELPYTVSATGYCNNENYEDRCTTNQLKGTLSYEYEELDYVECNVEKDNPDGAKCKVEKRKIPSVNMGNFFAYAEMNIKQVQTYFVHVYSGIVSTSPMGNISSIELEPNIYPVSLMTPKGSYPVTFKYSKVGDDEIRRTTREDPGNGSYTCNVVVDNDTTLFDCEGGCCYDSTGKKICSTGETCKNKNPDGTCNSDALSLGFVYRTIDLESIFPSNRTPGSNWQVTGASSIINSIQTVGNGIWGEEPEYSFELTPQNRSLISNYNKDAEKANEFYTIGSESATYVGSGYLSNTLINCGVSSDKEFVNCRSSFLKDGATLGYFTGGKN